MVLHLVSAGAAQSLVTGLAETLKVETGTAVDAVFGAVGAMKEKVLGGAPCDIVILSREVIDQLVDDGRVVRDTVSDVGAVRTGVAVRSRDPLPDVADANGLRSSLRAAEGIYMPDPQRATAGIRFADILKRLGIAEEVAARLHTYPNGSMAMRALAAAPGERVIGCTQITEIKQTPGVKLVSALPAEFELSTTYAVGVTTNAVEPVAARRFAAMLSGDDARDARIAAGFDS
jgi:molybdate transport system substrate-binding protein